MTPQVTARGRYQQLETDRSIYLNRAYDCAELTIPSLLPRNELAKGGDLYKPWQSVGARGVNNLANKYHLAILPPNAPFFRYMADDSVLERLTNDPGAKAAIEQALAQLERRTMKEIESAALRGTALEAFKHLLVAGNYLIYLPEKGGVKGFRLNRYVVRRDGAGNMLELVVKESVSPDAVPEEVRQAAGSDAAPSTDAPGTKQSDLDLYTRVYRQGDLYQVYQEVNGKEVPGSRGSYPLDGCPWLPLRLIKVDGEDYSRSHVEEYYGDLRSLENLSQAIVEGVAALSKLLILVKPNGVTSIKVIQEAPNGAVRSGNAEDVTTVQSNKAVDFRVAQELTRDFEQRLGFAFLLNSAVQRSGERVTAEEIRFVAGELEQTQGGAYTTLANEFQLPLVLLTMRRMKRARKMPKLPPGLVTPTILTGLDALGRGADFMRLQEFLAAVKGLLTPEQFVLYIVTSDLMKRLATGTGIDPDGLVRTEDQVQELQRIQQIQALAAQAVPGAMDMARDQVNPANQQPQEG